MSNIFLKNASDEVRHFIDKIEFWIKGSRFEGRVYVVGGAVRDAILGMPVNDIDIAVEMINGGISFANWIASKDGSFKKDSNPIVFERYGTAKVSLLNDENCHELDVECVQTRKERYDIDSRKPQVAYGTILDDALRRDLTVNALYYNISSKEIIDVLGTSFSDIESKVLRTPLDPNETFSEDPLRMMRTIRFSTKFDWGIEKDTWMGILKNRDRISIVSQERVTDEFTKILLCAKPSEGIIKLRYSGLLEYIAKDVFDEKDEYECKATNTTYFDHTMKVLDQSMPIEEHRLAALFHDVGGSSLINDPMYNASFSSEMAKCTLESMKYPKKMVNSIVKAIELHDYFHSTKDGDTPSDKNIRKFVNACGSNIAITLDLMNANYISMSHKPKKRLVFNLLNRIDELEKQETNSNIVLPINGNDIMKEFNLRPSPIIGKMLEKVKDGYFENPNITKEECLSIVREELAKVV